MPPMSAFGMPEPYGDRPTPALQTATHSVNKPIHYLSFFKIFRIPTECPSPVR